LRRRWGLEERQTLIRLRAKNVNPAGIVHQLNKQFWSGTEIRTPTAVTRYLENNGLNID